MAGRNGRHRKGRHIQQENSVAASLFDRQAMLELRKGHPGVCGLMLVLIMIATCLSQSAVVAEPINAFCERPVSELEAKFLTVADIRDRSAKLPAPAGAPRFARWNERNRAIQVFVRRTARKSPDTLKRNFAIGNGIGLLGGPSPIQFGVRFGEPERDQGIDNPSDDVLLIFIDRPTKQKVFASLPRSVLSSPERDQCRVYFELASVHDPVTPISRTNILVDDDVDTTELAPCLASAFTRSAGLVHWRTDDRNFNEARMFLWALYAISEKADSATLREHLAQARTLVCDGMSKR